MADDGVVFISHEKNDSGIAREIRAFLEAGGFSCWMAPDDIRGPAPWPEQIADAIDSSAVMLVVVSAHANNSPHVSREVDLALEKGKPLLPVRVADIVPTGSLDYLLRLAQWIDLFPGSIAEHADVLQSVVGSMLAERGLAPPAEPPSLRPAPAPPPGRHLSRRVQFATAAGLAAVVAVVAVIVALQGGGEPSAELDDEPAAQGELDEEQSAQAELDDEPPAGSAEAGSITRVSVASNGSEANGHSVNASISADGRYIAFDSAASNLVEGDSGRHRDVFIHDRETGETTRISQITYGDRVEEGDDGSSHPVISGNGLFVVYQSGASNLDPDRGGNPLFLFDRETGRNRNIGFNEAGQQHPSELIDADVSDDGTIVAYATYPGGEPPPEGVAARPMDERGTNYEVWVHDTESGITTRMATFDLSLTSVTHGPRATPDGAFVWVAGGISGGTLVFERATGATTEVYRDIEIDYLVPFPDGQRIAFTSGNSLVPDDVNGADDAYVYDRSSGEFALLLEHDPDRGLPLPSSISNDGRYVAMAGRGSPLVLDANENSIVAELSPSLGLQALAISGNGQWIAYATSAEVVDGDTNGTKTSSWHACLSTSPREATRPARTNGRWAGRRRLDHAGQLGLQRLQSRRPQCQSPVFR